MIKNLRESFKEMITELNWMEDGTKSLAREKVAYFVRLLLSNGLKP